MVPVTRLTLGPGEVHVRFAVLGDFPLPVLEASALGWLDPEERALLQRRRTPGGRHEYLLTRAVCRGLLSCYAPVEPRTWRFSTNAWGRPEIAGPDPCDRLRFNLSNTHGLVAVILTRGLDAGVDVEDSERPGRTVEIADRFFAGSEVEDLHRVPVQDRRNRFFDFWTLKEAYIKARGMGLALPLDQFGFRLPPGCPGEAIPDGAIGIGFGPGIEDDPGAWEFRLRRPTGRHVLAAGVRRPTGVDLVWSFGRLDPGGLLAIRGR